MTTHTRTLVHKYSHIHTQMHPPLSLNSCLLRYYISPSHTAPAIALRLLFYCNLIFKTIFTFHCFSPPSYTATCTHTLTHTFFLGAVTAKVIITRTHMHTSCCDFSFHPSSCSHIFSLRTGVVHHTRNSVRTAGPPPPGVTLISPSCQYTPASGANGTRNVSLEIALLCNQQSKIRTITNTTLSNPLRIPFLSLSAPSDGTHQLLPRFQRAHYSNACGSSFPLHL